MSVQELEEAVTQLPTPELAQFTAWFRQYQAARLAQECAKLNPAEGQAWAELVPTLGSGQ